MSIDVIFLIIAGAFAGGFVNGLAGFGTGLFALGWWLAALPPLDAVITVVIMSLVGGLQGLYAVRHAVDLPQLARFLLPSFVGIIIGFIILDAINATILKFLVACMLILYGGYFTFSKKLPTLQKRYPVIDGLVGFLGGFLGVIGGLSGSVMTMWCSLYDWPKAERRALTQPFNMAVLGSVFASMAWRGLIDAHIWLIVAIAFPFSVMGTQLGIFVFRRLTDRGFQQLLIWLILASGLMLVGRELTATVLAG
ncbi:sulfite exporter TauE/SafE family protein [Alphaproteobacteria bacterium LSUCC0684]